MRRNNRNNENRGYFKIVKATTNPVTKIENNLENDYMDNCLNKMKYSIVKVPTRQSLIKKPRDHESIGKFNKDWSIKSMVNYYKAGYLDFHSPHQKESAWTLKQKKDYIISLFHHESDIKSTLILNDDKNMLQENLAQNHFIVIDGKQRFSAIIEFYSNEFTVSTGTEEICYERLIDEDKFFFLSLNIDCTIIFSKETLKTIPMELQSKLFSTLVIATETTETKVY